LKRSVVFLAAVAALAQTETSQRLTLREAIEIGLRPGNRADASLARESVARAESVARQGRAAMMPLIESKTSGGERSVNLGAQGFGGGVGAPISLNPSFTNFDTRPTVSMTLVNLAQWKSWRAAKMDVGRTGSELDATLDAAAYDIARRYLTTLEAQADRIVAEVDLRLSADLRRAAEDRLRAGTVTVVDVTRAKSQEASDRGTLATRRQAEEEAKAALFRAIGLEYNEAIELSPTTGAEGVRTTLDEALRQANGRPDIRQRQEALRIAEAKIKAVNWEKYPSLSANFDIGRNGVSVPDSAWTRNTTLTLSLTLFDFGRRGERESQAAIAAREERIRLDDLLREVRRQVRVAIGKQAAADAQVEAAKAETELANLQLEQVRERATAGLATGLDIADAQTRLARAARSTVKAEYSRQSAGVEVLNAMGSLRQRID
jgi:outer membrane protein TolC